MTKRLDISFRETTSPITEPVTKFGGQPVWIAEPAWPLSGKTGEPMQFICQVAVDPEVFGGPPGRMVYLFMTRSSEGEYVDGTWEPEGGENAVIVQPSEKAYYGGRIRTLPSATGLTLYRLKQGPDSGLTEAVPCEFAVELTASEDPEPVSDEETVGWNDEEHDAYYDSLTGNKIGGEPGFIQGEEYPGDGSWRFFLQLEMMEVPFEIDFGDAGVGYAFLSGDGEEGRFLWQCH